jgi:hypothetical protein
MVLNFLRCNLQHLLTVHYTNFLCFLRQLRILYPSWDFSNSESLKKKDSCTHSLRRFHTLSSVELHSTLCTSCSSSLSILRWGSQLWDFTRPAHSLHSSCV